VDRKAAGETGWTQVLSTEDCTATNASAVIFWALPGTSFRWDDIRIVSDDCSTTKTFEYDDANELTKMSYGGGDTAFTYDDWGRMVTKSATGHEAIYKYRYGDKLKEVTKLTQGADYFPGETGVQFMYDGLGKRRFKLPEGGDFTWFRWDAGFRLLGIYGEGSDPNSIYDVGDPAILYTHDPARPGNGVIGATLGSDPEKGSFCFFT
jgi:YD repeat-containing protein